MQGITLYFSLGLLTEFVFSAPNVILSRGILSGVDEEAATTQKPLHAYYGIPFAQPPVGNLRFKPPQPFYANDSNRIINSRSFQKACVQSDTSSNPQSEDCLYLNVFTPGVGADNTFDPKTGRKVMFWIHGGGYTSGDAIIYHPKKLVTDYDVIIVTTQYRLGLFGFISSGDEVLPGNMGLHDQIMALQWVKDNIRSFGGDPDDVTIFGESAGGSSVNLLSLSPVTKGLFTKGIMQSGSALAPFSFNHKPEDSFYLVAEKANCLPMFYIPIFSFLKPSYNRQIVKCLRKVTARDLQNLMDKEAGDVEKKAVIELGSETMKFAPVADGVILPKAPLSLVTNSSYMAQIGALNRKYMIGFNNNEMATLSLATIFDKNLQKQFSNLDDPFTQGIIKQSVEILSSFPATTDVLNFASFMYLFPRDWKKNVNIKGLDNIMSDAYFVIPAIQMTRALVNHQRSPEVYLYLFDHYPELKQPGNIFEGTHHALDMAYLFDEDSPIIDTLTFAVNPYTPSSLPLLDIFRGSLTNFAKTGNPTRAGGPKWPRYDRQNESYMAISPTPEIRQRVFNRRVSFWTDFIPRVVSAIFTNGPWSATFRV